MPIEAYYYWCRKMEELRRDQISNENYLYRFMNMMNIASNPRKRVMKKLGTVTYTIRFEKGKGVKEDLNTKDNQDTEELMHIPS